MAKGNLTITVHTLYVCYLTNDYLIDFGPVNLRADHLIDQSHSDPPLQPLLEHEVAVLALGVGHWNGNVLTTWTKLTDLKVSQDVHLGIRVSGAK